MPDVVPLECPECGARLNPGPDADTVRCVYCGTTSRIADLRPAAPPAAPAQLQAQGHRARIVSSSPGRWWRWRLPGSPASWR